jgi:hypothetical protein
MLEKTEENTKGNENGTANKKLKVKNWTYLVKDRKA